PAKLCALPAIRQCGAEVGQTTGGLKWLYVGSACCAVESSSRPQGCQGGAPTSARSDAQQPASRRRRRSHRQLAARVDSRALVTKVEHRANSLQSAVLL